MDGNETIDVPKSGMASGSFITSATSELPQVLFETIASDGGVLNLCVKTFQNRTRIWCMELRIDGGLADWDWMERHST